MASDSLGSSIGSAVLSLLFGSIGIADPTLTDRALAILLEASETLAAPLLRHHDLALSVLPGLDELDDSQSRALCRLFARMLVAEGSAGADLIDGDQFPFAAAVQHHFATCLASGDVLKLRVAVVGQLEWQFALALASAEQAEAAQNMLEALIGQAARQPPVFAFLCQTLADMCLEHLRGPAAVDPVRCLPLQTGLPRVTGWRL